MYSLMWLLFVFSYLLCKLVSLLIGVIFWLCFWIIVLFSTDPVQEVPNCRIFTIEDANDSYRSQREKKDVAINVMGHEIQVSHQGGYPLESGSREYRLTRQSRYYSVTHVTVDSTRVITSLHTNGDLFWYFSIFICYMWKLMIMLLWLVVCVMTLFVLVVAWNCLSVGYNFVFLLRRFNSVVK